MEAWLREYCWVLAALALELVGLIVFFSSTRRRRPVEQVVITLGQLAFGLAGIALALGLGMRVGEAVVAGLAVATGLSYGMLWSVPRELRWSACCDGWPHTPGEDLERWVVDLGTGRTIEGTVERVEEVRI